MKEKFSGGEYLGKKYDDLKKSESVKLSHEFSREKEPNPIDTWLKSVENFHKRHRDDPEEMRHIRTAFHNEYVIKPEDIPDGYFKSQQRLARERGEGNIEITPALKKQLAETIIKDQQSSLDNWVNYFTSADADVYPMWAKYWAFRSMVKLSSYDKEKKEFGNRRKDTVAPFPELNHEALARVIDIIGKKAKDENIAAAENNAALQKLIQKEDFGKLYAHFLEESILSEANDELLKTTKGRWVKYEMGSNHMPLVNSLQGKGTGWCTAGESTAEIQLKGGDFCVFYSNDKDGNPTVPRAAIRMGGNQIAEIRGIADKQNLDPYINDVVEKKLDEFPDKEKYKKKTADMKLLTHIDNKHKKGEKLTRDELRFLYEIYSKIKGFGLYDDPRIEEIKKLRNLRQDYAEIFGCQPDHIALNDGELNDNTIVFKGDFYLIESYYDKPSTIKKSPNVILGNFRMTFTQAIFGLGAVVKELPPNLKSITGSLDLRQTEVKKLPDGLIHIGRNLLISRSNVERFEWPANIKDIVKGRIKIDEGT